MKKDWRLSRVLHLLTKKQHKNPWLVLKGIHHYCKCVYFFSGALTKWKLFGVRRYCGGSNIEIRESRTTVNETMGVIPQRSLAFAGGSHRSGVSWVVRNGFRPYTARLTSVGGLCLRKQAVSWLYNCVCVAGAHKPTPAGQSSVHKGTGLPQ